MNLEDFFKSKPRVGTKVLLQVEATYRTTHAGRDQVLDAGGYEILSTDGEALKPWSIVNPQLPLKLGAVIYHSQYGICTLHLNPESPNAVWFASHYVSDKGASEPLKVNIPMIIGTGYFQVLFGGVGLSDC